MRKASMTNAAWSRRIKLKIPKWRKFCQQKPSENLIKFREMWLWRLTAPLSLLIIIKKSIHTLSVVRMIQIQGKTSKLCSVRTIVHRKLCLLWLWSKIVGTWQLRSSDCHKSSCWSRFQKIMIGRLHFSVIWQEQMLLQSLDSSQWFWCWTSLSETKWVFKIRFCSRQCRWQMKCS